MNQWRPSVRETAGDATVRLQVDSSVWTELPASPGGADDRYLARRFVDDGFSGACTLSLGLLPAFGRRLERLYLLTRADTTGADELQIEHRCDESLGRSVRVLRQEVPDRDHPEATGACAVRQAWRLSPDTDLLITLVAPDAEVLTALMGEFECLVETIRLDRRLEPAEVRSLSFALAQGA